MEPRKVSSLLLNFEGTNIGVWVYIAIFVSDCAPSSGGIHGGISPPNVHLKVVAPTWNLWIAECAKEGPKTRR